MKTLILLRHGKSDWASAVPDHERPINKRGRAAATRMAQWIEGAVGIPDRMLVSSSTRTQQTADRLVAEWGDVGRMTLDALYLAEPDAILGAVRGEGKGGTLLVLGHNPGLEHVVAQFSDGARPPAMPTCAAAVLRFGIGRWSEAGVGGGTLLHHVTPKSLD